MPTASALQLLLFAACSSVFACGADRGTIGALLAQTPDQRLLLREVPENLASARAGLRPGDEILLIDGRDVRELDERGVHRALGGSAGDPVKLTVVRGNEVIRVTLRRTPPPQGGTAKTPPAPTSSPSSS